MVGGAVLQHEPGRELGSHHRHRDGPELQLEDHSVRVWRCLCGRGRGLLAGYQERA